MPICSMMNPFCDNAREIRTGKYDLVVGSRNIAGGSMGEFARERVALSNVGLAISKLVSRHNLTDPMSGYFLITRESWNL